MHNRNVKAVLIIQRVKDLLLMKGTTVNQANAKDETPLYIAVNNGHTEIVDLLLQNGAEDYLK